LLWQKLEICPPGPHSTLILGRWTDVSHSLFTGRFEGFWRVQFSSTARTRLRLAFVGWIRGNTFLFPKHPNAEPHAGEVEVREVGRALLLELCWPEQEVAQQRQVCCCSRGQNRGGRLLQNYVGWVYSASKSQTKFWAHNRRKILIFGWILIPLNICCCCFQGRHPPICY
jgi:hypothetical protein